MTTTEITISYGPEHAGAYVRLYASLLTGSQAVIPVPAVNSEKWALQSDGFVLVSDGFLDHTGKKTFQWEEVEHDPGRLQAVVNLVGGWRLSNAVAYGEPPMPLPSAFVDYSIVPDTADYVDPKLTATATAAACDVVSGRFITTTDGESSFYFKNSELDLIGQTYMYAKMTKVTTSTAAGKGVLFFSNSTTPGSVTVISAGTLTGYDIVIGSGTTGIVNRVIAGSRTTIGTFPFTNYSLADVELRMKVNAGNVTLTAYKNDVEIGTPIVDSDPTRVTAIRSVGKGMRQAFGQTISMDGFGGGALAA